MFCLIFEEAKLPLATKQRRGRPRLSDEEKARRGYQRKARGDWMPYLRSRVNAEEACGLYRAGNTLEQIGQRYGVSRERVRQILKLNGINKSHSLRPHLIAKAQKIKADARHELMNARCLRLYGISLDEKREILARFGYKAFLAFRYQRRNASLRGIAFNFLFNEWWRIWQASGKWEERGRGFGYCMARLADKGGYETGNVEIISSPQNVKDGYVNLPYSMRKHQTKRGVNGLTARETQYLALEEIGKTHRQIAAELGVGKETVKNFLRLLRKRKT